MEKVPSPPGRFHMRAASFRSENEWNPWLQSTGSNLYVEFGVGKGADYDQFANYYLNPANLAELPGYLFVQTTDSAGNMTPGPLGPDLRADIDFVAAAELGRATRGRLRHDQYQLPAGVQCFHHASGIAAAHLPDRQRLFQRADPDVNSDWSLLQGIQPRLHRGESAVPRVARLHAEQSVRRRQRRQPAVETGNLDLRLAAIETVYGGNIYLLGPGGHVLGGSTVATSAQAARTATMAALLYSGYANDAPEAASIETIPRGMKAY
jgi:hypothetical protein